jgi:photosystem II stability/assembly factor-like uncharacterized protein
MGLGATMHISRILVDPRNEDTVYVGGLGRLWGASDERGVYKTTDGGKTWQRLLFVNDLTGPIDMIMDPSNPNTLIVAMWERLRKAYDWTSGGEGTGLYKSTDGGRTWRKITRGLPQGGKIGRIGLDYFRRNPKVVIATIEHGDTNAEGRRVSESGTYRSTDGGESWTKVNSLNPRPFYFSMPKQDPLDENRIYVPAVQMHVSDDKGGTFRIMRTDVHVDHHAMWINPADSNHLIIGQDGGVAQSRDRGAKWEHINSMPLGQYYGIAFDMRKPYHVYGGLQDNGSWGIPTQTRRGGVAFWDAYNVGGGDGFHVQVDPTDWSTLYSESQGGVIARLNLRTGERRGIRPAIQGERLRFNWSSPFILSPHNPSVIYFGANRLFMSVNRGDAWTAISPDLTTNDPAKQRPGANSATPENTGAEAHCTIITISESPRLFGLLWVGTDDGLVHLTRDGGKTWENVTPNIPGLPANTWCSRVTASRWDTARAYATFDGHRSNDFKPYVYVTEDFGKTWKPLTSGLPDYDSVYVIKEGEKNPDLLYLGSEMSLRISLDRGQTWSRVRNGFPTVAVHDLAVHPRELDLVIGTHGRSIWTMNVSHLEQLSAENRAKDAFLCDPQAVLLMGRNIGGAGDGHRIWMAPNTQPGTQIGYHLKEEVQGGVKIQISDPAGRLTQDLNGPGKAGLNVVLWNGRIRNRLADPGEYRVILTVNGTEYVTSVKVEEATDAGS